MTDYLYGMRRMKTVTIKELIAMYAPTVLMVISVIANYIKTFAELKKNVVGNKEVTDKLKKEITDLKTAIANQAKDNLELKNLNMELINELKKVQKYDTDTKI